MHYILTNDFNLVIADDYLREYAAFDARKNKDELFDLTSILHTVFGLSFLRVSIL